MEKIIDFIKKHHIIILSFILTITFFYTIYLKNGFFYIMNDDVVMKNFASGIYTSKAPTPYMIYSIFPSNVIIMLLYKITIKLDWYGIFMISLMIFFTTYTLYLIIKKQVNLKYKFLLSSLFFLFMALLYNKFFSYITFTVVAAYIVTNCLIIYILSDSKLSKILIFIGILLSFGIRKDACLMISIFFVPLFIYKNIGNKTQFIKDFKYYLILFATLFICLLINNQLIMNNKEWNKYLKYNNYRSEFYDYYWSDILNLEKSKRDEIFKNADFTTDEEYFLCNYSLYGFMNDIPKKMPKLINEIKKAKVGSNSYKSNILLFLKNNKVMLIYYFISLVLLVVSLNKYNSKNKKLAFLLAIIIEGLLITYLIVKGRFPERVTIPLISGYIIVNLLLIYNKRPSPLENNKYSTITIVLSIIIILLSTYFVQIDSEHIKWTNKKNKILFYFMEHKENLYIYNRDTSETFTLRTKYNTSNYIKPCGWTVFTPLHKELMEKWGASTLKDVALQKNVYIVLPSQDIKDLKKIYKDESFVLIDVVDDNYIYRITKDQ